VWCLGSGLRSETMTNPQERMTSIEPKQSLRSLGRFAIGVSAGLALTSVIGCSPGDIGGNTTGAAGNTMTGAAGTTSTPGAAGTAPIAVACGQMFASTYGQRLFRRALTPAEVTSYATYLNSESKLDPAATAVASVLKAMLMSPNFLYRTELGTSKPGAVDMTQD